MIAAQARVLLTGAGGGIGHAMLTQLLAAGAQVLGVGRRPGPNGLPWVQADLASAEGRNTTVAAATQFNANVIVHAAGISGFGALGALPPGRIEAIMATNLLAPVLLTQRLLPELLTQPRAQIVFVGSALGRIGLPGFSVYGASKAGLHGFAEALRRELADSHVRVQILAPRSTRTSFNDDDVEAYNRATGAAIDTPEVVAAALVSLIQSEAAERFVGIPERLAVRLNAMLGPMLDTIFKPHRRHLTPLPQGNQE